jgi:hypothetical protein
MSAPRCCFAFGAVDVLFSLGRRSASRREVLVQSDDPRQRLADRECPGCVIDDRGVAKIAMLQLDHEQEFRSRSLG